MLEKRHCTSAVSCHCCSCREEAILSGYFSARSGAFYCTGLLIERGASLLAQDFESGWTPLHAAIYAGNVGVALLLLGSGAVLSDTSTGPLQTPQERRPSERKVCHDAEGKSPLDLATLLCEPAIQRCRFLTFSRNYSELKASRVLGLPFSWGQDKHHLGYATAGSNSLQFSPRLISHFPRNRVSITALAVGNLHALALDMTGKVYAWGVGRSGRLGNDSEQVEMTPLVVKPLAHECVVQISASEGHSLCVTNDGKLYSWGRGNVTAICAGVRPSCVCFGFAQISLGSAAMAAITVTSQPHGVWKDR